VKPVDVCAAGKSRELATADTKCRANRGETQHHLENIVEKQQNIAKMLGPILI